MSTFVVLLKGTYQSTSYRWWRHSQRSNAESMARIFYLWNSGNGSSICGGSITSSFPGSSFRRRYFFQECRKVHVFLYCAQRLLGPMACATHSARSDGTKPWPWSHFLPKSMGWKNGVVSHLSRTRQSRRLASIWTYVGCEVCSRIGALAEFPKHTGKKHKHTLFFECERHERDRWNPHTGWEISLNSCGQTTFAPMWKFQPFTVTITFQMRSSVFLFAWKKGHISTLFRKRSNTSWT